MLGEKVSCCRVRYLRTAKVEVVVRCPVVWIPRIERWGKGLGQKIFSLPVTLTRCDRRSSQIKWFVQGQKMTRWMSVIC